MGQVSCRTPSSLTLKTNETLAALAALRPEPLLLRWFNYHLERSGAQLRIAGFGCKDVSSGVAYLRLIAAISPEPCSLDLTGALFLPAEFRLAKVLEWAQGLGCAVRIRAGDIAAGHPRLNLVFVAGLFNAQVGIHLPSEEEVRALFQEVAGLRSKVSSLDAELEAIRPRDVELSTLRLATLSLESQLEAAQESHRQELLQLEAEFESFKEELAGQYREGLEGELATLRRAHQHELGGLRAQLRESRRRVHAQVEDLRAALSPAQLDGTKAGEMLRRLDSNPEESTASSGSLEHLISLHGHLARHLLSLTSSQSARIAELESQLAQKQQMEEVMALKVREYSEQLIAVKQAEQEKVELSKRQQEEEARQRQPALQVFRERTLPALRRAFTCSGR